MSKSNVNIHEVNISNDLPKAITDLFISLGHNRPNDWTRYVHPDAFVVQDINIQRFLINRAFRLILGDCLLEDTMNARYCLVDTGEIKDWLRLFKDGVAPQVIRLCLPPALN